MYVIPSLCPENTPTGHGEVPWRHLLSHTLQTPSSPPEYIKLLFSSAKVTALASSWWASICNQWQQEENSIYMYMCPRSYFWNKIIVMKNAILVQYLKVSITRKISQALPPSLPLPLFLLLSLSLPLSCFYIFLPLMSGLASHGHTNTNCHH